MKKNKLVGLVAICALSFSLAACTDKEEKEVDPKNEYTSLHEKLTTATSYSSSSTIKVHLENKDETMSEMDKEHLKAVNESELKVDVNFDKNVKKTEMIFFAKGNGMTVELPLLVDEKENKVYTKVDMLLNLFPMAREQFGEKLNGKLVEFDIDTLNAQLPAEEQIDLSTAKGNEKLEKAVNAELDKFFENKKESDFKKEGDKVTASFDYKELSDLLKVVADVVVKHEDDAKAKEELEAQLAQSKSLVAGSLENYTVTDISSSFKVSKTGELESSQTVVVITTIDPVTKKEASMTITADTTYSNLNKKVTFITNPKDNTLVTTEELLEMYSEVMAEQNAAMYE